MNEWISVKDKIPNNRGKKYIVYIIYKEDYESEKFITGYKDILYFDIDEKKWCTFNDLNYFAKYSERYLRKDLKVTHWMNFPDSPELDENFDRWIPVNKKSPSKNEKVFILYHHYMNYNLKIKIGTIDNYLDGFSPMTLIVTHWRKIPKNWNENMEFPKVDVNKLTELNFLHEYKYGIEK